MRFQSLNKDFGDRLVDGVAETNGTILVYGFKLANFRYQADEGGIQVGWDFPCQENAFYAGDDGMTHNSPKPLEKDGMKAIQAEGFQRFKGENDPFNFTVGDISRNGLEDLRRGGLEVSKG